jgi:outer membrane lipoprotein-sorting protein
LVLLSLTASAARAEALEVILSRMDQSAKIFKSLSARMKELEFTAILNESSERSGEVRLKRGKGGTVGIIEFIEPSPQIIHINGRTVENYFPKANTVDIYDVGKFTRTIDHVLLIGLGTSGADLRKEYTLKVIGSEQLDSVNTTRIELTPKSADLKKMVTKIELWIPDGQSNPVQEKASQPSKDYRVFKYADIKVNPALSESAFQLALPAGVKKNFPK